METGSKAAPFRENSEYFAPNFSDEPANVHILIIEIGFDFVKACWYNKSKNIITGFARYPVSEDKALKSIAALQAKHAHLRYEFDQCICICPSNNYALIPSNLSKEQEKIALSVTNKIEPNEVLLHQDVIGLKSKIVLIEAEENVAAINLISSNVITVSKMGARIEAAFNTIKNSEIKTKIIAHLESNRVHIMIFKNGTLQLCNSFFTAGVEDYAYYILYMAESTHIDPETEELLLSGEITSGDAVWNTLSDYWKLISIEEPLAGVGISSELDARNKVQFDYLSHHLLCAS